MSYEVFIITLQGDYYDDPIFQKITQRWESIILGLTLARWQNNPSDSRSETLLAVSEMPQAYTTRAGSWGWGEDVGRVTGAVAGEHGGHREEKQEPSKKFGLWFHWKRPWIPNSGVWIWWCTQCCCENVVGEQMKLFPAGCCLVVQFMSASCNTLW